MLSFAHAFHSLSPDLESHFLIMRSIYDQSIKGKHSTVYKGRKKESIMYFAIKSVDKTQREQVLQGVNPA